MRTSELLAAAQGLVKTALQTERGGLPSRALASSVGLAGNAAGIVPWLITPRTFINPKVAPNVERAREMEQGAPENLDFTKLRLGGTDVIDDLIWRRETADNPLPWYKQLGGRMVHNPRTTLIGKILGYMFYGPEWLQSNVMRSNAYWPTTDVAHIYADSLPITEHELGHAIDFNHPLSKDKGVKGYAKNYGKALLRDLYMLGGASIPTPVGTISIPGAPLWYEAQANIKSRRALEKSQDKEKFKKTMYERNKVLPGAFGSYVGGEVGRFVPGAGIMPVLMGIAGGKQYGLAMNQEADRATAKEKAEGRAKTMERAEQALRLHEPAAKEKQPEDKKHEAKKDDKKHEDKKETPVRKAAMALLKAALDISTGTKARARVPKSEFAMPNKAPEGESKEESRGSYPMPDKAHYAAAKGFAAMHHGKDSAQYRAVVRKAKSMGYEKAAAPTKALLKAALDFPSGPAPGIQSALDKGISGVPPAVALQALAPKLSALPIGAALLQAAERAGKPNLGATLLDSLYGDEPKPGHTRPLPRLLHGVGDPPKRAPVGPDSKSAALLKCAAALTKQALVGSSSTSWLMPPAPGFGSTIGVDPSVAAADVAAVEDDTPRGMPAGNVPDYHANARQLNAARLKAWRGTAKQPGLRDTAQADYDKRYQDELKRTGNVRNPIRAQKLMGLWEAQNKIRAPRDMDQYYRGLDAEAQRILRNKNVGPGGKPMYPQEQYDRLVAMNRDFTLGSGLDVNGQPLPEAERVALRDSGNPNAFDPRDPQYRRSPMPAVNRPAFATTSGTTFAPAGRGVGLGANGAPLPPPVTPTTGPGAPKTVAPPVQPRTPPLRNAVLRPGEEILDQPPLTPFNPANDPGAVDLLGHAANLTRPAPAARPTSGDRLSRPVGGTATRQPGPGRIPQVTREPEYGGATTSWSEPVPRPPAETPVLIAPVVKTEQEPPKPKNAVPAWQARAEEAGVMPRTGDYRGSALRLPNIPPVTPQPQIAPAPMTQFKPLPTMTPPKLPSVPRAPRAPQLPEA